MFVTFKFFVGEPSDFVVNFFMGRNSDLQKRPCVFCNIQKTFSLILTILAFLFFVNQSLLTFIGYFKSDNLSDRHSLCCFISKPNIADKLDIILPIPFYENSRPRNIDIWQKCGHIFRQYNGASERKSLCFTKMERSIILLFFVIFLFHRVHKLLSLLLES